VCEFLEALGYEFDYEFLRDGFMFKNTKNIITTLTHIKKLSERADFENAELIQKNIFNWM